MITGTFTRLAIAAVSAAATLAASLGAAAGSITLAPVLSGLASPVFVTNAHDGGNRLFVVEQGGVIEVLQPGSASPTVFLDITPKVVSGGEQGLLGLTFHPQFSSNRRFFVDYTRRSDGATVIAEYHASPGNPNASDPTETVLLVIPQPFANHNGGMVEFGPDGFLYIGMGDGGSANDPDGRAQDLKQFLGKILRIDVDHPNGAQPYSSPPSNPFFGPGPELDEIYAYGFRNPWRFSFDRATGTLYAGDVGQDAVEEIDVVTRGSNYGWRIWEGSRCTGDPQACTTNDFIFPIAEYGHTAGRCSVTGGYVYRGARSSLPVGAYVYGDFCSGEIFIFQNGASRLALGAGLSISSFGDDESGELYVVDLGGSIYRIVNACSILSEASCPPLGLLASVNQPAFSVGQVLTTTVGLTNPGLPGTADLYVGVLLPDASTIVLRTSAGGAAVGDLADLRALPPIAAGVPLASPFSVTAPSLFSYQRTGNEPRGTYVFFLLAVQAGALADGTVADGELLGLATAPFSFP